MILIPLEFISYKGTNSIYGNIFYTWQWPERYVSSTLIKFYKELSIRDARPIFLTIRDRA